MSVIPVPQLRFPMADFSKLPADTKFPLVNVVFSAGAIFDSGWRGDKNDLEGWYAHQAAHMDEPMARGPAFDFFQRLVALNKYSTDMKKKPLVHAHIVSRYAPEPEAVLRLINSLEHEKIYDHSDTTFISTSFLGGASPMEIIEPLNDVLAHGVSLYVGTDVEVVKELIKRGIPAVVAQRAGPVPAGKNDPRQPDRFTLGFDGDSTGFGRSSDDSYVLGLPAFQKHEEAHRDEVIEDGPLFKAIKAFARIRALFPRFATKSPFNLVFLTMRGPTGQRRVALTLLDWKRRAGIVFDKAVFLTHLLQKGPIALSLGVNHFEDDGKNHNQSTRDNGVDAGHVPFGPKNDELKPGVVLDEHGKMISGPGMNPSPGMLVAPKEDTVAKSVELESTE